MTQKGLIVDKNLLITRTRPEIQNIPQELRALAQWVCWKLEKSDSSKPAKVPYNPKTSGRAKANDPGTWASFEEALKAFDKNPSYFGIGFVFSKDDPFCGIDLDRVRDPKTGELTKDAREITDQFKSYCEISPSGTGLKIWVKGKLPKDAKHQEGEEHEVYDSERFFTVSGNPLNGHGSIGERQEELDWYYQRYILGDKPQVRKISKDELAKMLNGVEDGNRNNTLKRLIGHWIATRLNDDEILVLLREWNRKNKPPLREKTLTTCLHNIRELDAERQTAASSIHLTDLGNAQRLVVAFGADVRFCYRWKKWLTWDGKHWVKDDAGGIDRLAKEIVQQMYREAAEIEDKEERTRLASFAFRCESESRLSAMVELAKSEEGIPIQPEDLDRDHWLLNVANGTIDLKTGELQPYRKEDYITRMINVESQPEARCPFWISHLMKIMNKSEEMVNFLQRAFGYSLTGNTDERVFFILWGEAFNGKTLTVETVKELLGSYASSVPTETLFIKKQESIPNDIARLNGVRFISSSEGEKGKRLAEALVKKLFGGGTTEARFLYSEWFNFTPTFKLFFETNHKPKVSPDDQAVWDRLRLIQFNVRISEKERIPKEEMMNRFREEFPGILAWMVKGCLAWQKDGLGFPPEVKEATEGYRKEMDYLRDFIREKCVTGPKERILVADLYYRFKGWFESQLELMNQDIPRERVFSNRIKDLGFKQEKITRGDDRGKFQWKGIGCGSF